MTTMHDLTTMKDALLAVVAEQDGELTPEQEAAWDAVEASFDYKVERTVLWIRDDLSGDVEKISDAIDRMKEKLAVAERAVSRAEEFLDRRMKAHGREKVKTPLASAWYQDSSKPTVSPLTPMDEAELRNIASWAPQYIRHKETWSLDREAILDAHKAKTLDADMAKRVAIKVSRSLRIR